MTENEMARARSAALGEFLEHNHDLFHVSESEDIEIEGPELITGAYLIIRSREPGGEGELTLTVCSPFALGATEKLGLIEVARIRAHSDYAGDD